jgi:hypothetical protein
LPGFKLWAKGVHAGCSAAGVGLALMWVSACDWMLCRAGVWVWR